MSEATSFSNHCGIEVSGWGSDDDFFVEKTQLLWTETGDKKLLLRRSLQDGAIIFLRLIVTEDAAGSVPMAYRIKNAHARNSSGLSEVHLQHLTRQPCMCPKPESSIIDLWLNAVVGLFESKRGLRSSKPLGKH